MAETQTATTDLMTRKEVANLLCVGERTIYNLIKRKAIPSYNIGGIVRFKRSEIQSIIDKSLTTAR